MGAHLHIDRLGVQGIATVANRGLRLRVAVACTARHRLVGLLGTRRLHADRALILAPCAAVHAVGVRYAIGVAFLDSSGLVLRVLDPLPRRGASCKGAHAVLEVAAGVLAEVRPGDVVQIDVATVFPLVPRTTA